jgi:hypothetical protein
MPLTVSIELEDDLLILFSPVSAALEYSDIKGVTVLNRFALNYISPSPLITQTLNRSSKNTCFNQHFT